MVGDEDACKRIGLKGVDLATKNLYYVRFTSLYCLPIHHLLLRGVVRNCIECLFDKKHRLMTKNLEHLLI